VKSSAWMGTLPSGWSVAGTGDFNGDGYGDVLFRDTAGRTAAWLLNGTQVISTLSFGTVPTAWSVVGTGDFNGDGISDVLWRNGADVAIWLMNGTSVATYV
jgi:FG-GAP-like repeat